MMKSSAYRTNRSFLPVHLAVGNCFASIVSSPSNVMLANTGEAVAPQHGEFVVQPLVERFQVIDALTQLRGQLAQLLGCQVIESGRIHGAECADSRRPRR